MKKNTLTICKTFLQSPNVVLFMVLTCVLISFPISLTPRSSAKSKNRWIGVGIGQWTKENWRIAVLHRRSPVLWRWIECKDKQKSCLEMYIVGLKSWCSIELLVYYICSY